jgi:hypothetical protein
MQKRDSIISSEVAGRYLLFAVTAMLLLLCDEVGSCNHDKSVL